MALAGLLIFSGIYRQQQGGERIQPKPRQLPPEPRQLPFNMPLPVVQSNVILASGEVCHYCAPAAFVKTKNVVVGYSGGSGGSTIRVAKGVSFRVGSQKASPVRGDVQEKSPGILSITNRRIVFSGNKGAFDKQISNLTAITPYYDGIAFQFGSLQYPLATKETQYICAILDRILNPPPETPNNGYYSATL